jgi:hypothetical protein
LEIQASSEDFFLWAEVCRVTAARLGLSPKISGRRRERFGRRRDEDLDAQKGSGAAGKIPGTSVLFWGTA